ncbi:UNVERIFIED_CONTAM: hypothetical protein Slati_3682800 [Sesamum latifolium]|uniref:DUF4216 domain-containing protein n=1 Tax=Sesamum latifolium TaxID=2727402 RepID=A0AAW2U0Z0_9LAMI
MNGYNFHMECHNCGKSTMNCGMCMKSSSYTDEDNDFYGIIEDIIQLTYPLILNFHVVLFKCCWVDPVRDMKLHPRYHLVDVDFKKVYQKDEPFILAQQAVHVYYIEHPSMKRDKADWMVVCKTKARRVVDESRWTDIAYQPEEVIPIPAVATDNQTYDLSAAQQQGAGTSRTQYGETDNEQDEDGEDSSEEYENNEFKTL